MTTAAKNAPKKFLTATEIRQAEDRPIVEVDMTAEWGGWIRVRALALDTYLKLKEEFSGDDVSDRAATHQLLKLGVVDENGDPMLTDTEVDDILGKGVTAVGKILLHISADAQEVLREAQTAFPVGE